MPPSITVVGSVNLDLVARVERLPRAGELVEWRPVLTRAGVQASPDRVTAVYLELAVLVRALQGLSDSARLDAPPDASSLWAGLFDLRDTLLGSTVDDLRALAA